MINILTIDLEDYFMVSGFESMVKREDWHKYESRIERNTYRLLEILGSSFRNPHSEIRTPVRATFFCIGWIAERFPRLIREICTLGHEIACHSYDHRLVYYMQPDTFREDIRKSKAILEGIIGEEVIGYRAPSYSITKKSLWSLEILAEEGYRYDSSIFPINHDRYGIPDASRFPFLIFFYDTKILRESASAREENFPEPSNLFREPSNIRSMPYDSSVSTRTSRLKHNASLFESYSADLKPLDLSLPNIDSRYLIEIPLSTIRFLGENIPVAGGGYFRFFPYPLIKKGLRRINEKERRPFIFYVHPWEIDPNQPRVEGATFLPGLRHRLNLRKTEGRLRQMVLDFQFTSIREGMSHLLSDSSAGYNST